MAIRFYKPHPALRPYIKHFGHIYICSSPPKEVMTVDFFPNGFSSLIVNLNVDRNIKDLSDGQNYNTFFKFSGQFDAHRHLSCAELNLVFITFSPLGAFQLLGMPQNCFLNVKVEMEDIFPKSASLFRRIEDAGENTSEVIQLLENWLLCRCFAAGQVNSDRVAVALKIIKETSGNLPINKLCQEAGMSISTLEEHFKEKVGITPKMFSRIERFNQCLQYIRHHDDVSWASVAYHFNYFDQMHFIREFKKFYGYTPANTAGSKLNVSRLLHS